MKLTITTEWDGNICYASSRLNDKKLRVQSCILQTQEYVFDLRGFIPTPQTIMEHMVEFSIDEI